MTLFFGQFFEQCGQRALALDQRRGCQVLAVEMEQVEDVIDHPVLAAVLEVVLQGGEIGDAVFVDRGDLAVEDDIVVGQARRRPSATAGNLSVQSRPVRVFSVTLPSPIRAWMR